MFLLAFQRRNRMRRNRLAPPNFPRPLIRLRLQIDLLPGNSQRPRNRRPHRRFPTQGAGHHRLDSADRSGAQGSQYPNAPDLVVDRGSDRPHGFGRVGVEPVRLEIRFWLNQNRSFGLLFDAFP